MRTVITDGQVITPRGIARGYVIIEDGRIAETGCGDAPEGIIIISP